jgi:YVTN family beta-propeller protein
MRILKHARNAAMAALLVAGGFAHAESAEIATGTFPLSAAATPDGKYLLVLNTGATPASISVIDLAASKELNRTPVPDAWLGLTLTQKGDKVYVGGGARAAVFEFAFSNGTLTAGRTFPVVPEKDRTAQDFVGDVKFAPDGHLLYVTNVFRDTVVVMNPQSGLVLSKIKTGRRPYRILFHPSGKTFYVSSWADGTIGQYDVNSGERLANVRVAPHPIDMLWVDGGLPEGASAGSESQPEIKARMFVPAANTNSLYVLGASETGDLTKLETINLSLTPTQPLGTTPSAVALSADKKLVYVVCSGVNAVAVVDITGEHNLVKGFIPTGAYPTAVTGLPDSRIAILNGRGNSVQIVDAPGDTKISSDSNEVMAKFPYRDEMLDPPVPPAGNPVHAGGPIKHIIVMSSIDSAAVTAGIENDFLVRLGRKFAGGGLPDPANTPPAGYLWNAVSQAGLKMRNYGFQVHNLAKPNADGEQVDRVYDPTLAPSTDMEYRGPDSRYPDTERAKEFATELGEYGQLGEMPELLLVRLGANPEAHRIVEDALSKSRFYRETAVFEIEPDGSAVVILPPVKLKGAVNDQIQALRAYDPFSALRTIEIILGLRPMTIFDASAKPIYDAFSDAFALPAQ